MPVLERDGIRQVIHDVRRLTDGQRMHLVEERGDTFIARRVYAVELLSSRRVNGELPVAPEPPAYVALARNQAVHSEVLLTLGLGQGLGVLHAFTQPAGLGEVVLVQVDQGVAYRDLEVVVIGGLVGLGPVSHVGRP
ncbi:hypothetical protein D3C79_685890 [compost metagenome]